MVNIWLGMLALLVLAFIVLLVKGIREDKEVDRIWRSLESTPSHERFTPEMVSALPPPARRYFLHAIAPGTPLASSVHLKMRGTFRLKEDAEWMQMQAEEIIAVLKGFVWKATIQQGFFKMVGADSYANQSLYMRFSLWGIIPLVNAKSPDIAKSAIARLALESIWLPSALLPQHGVSWEMVDDSRVKASLKIDGEPITLTLVVDTEGRLLEVSMLRWSDQAERGVFSYIPCGGTVQAEQTFGGFTIPSQMSAGYWFGTERYWNFFRATIESAQFS
ncbi:MAG TPA: DUF6544 family protein [Coleofasciculaceae cyanobacterium]